jgi:methyl-accepting chemotaxis protein
MVSYKHGDKGNNESYLNRVTTMNMRKNSLIWILVVPVPITVILASIVAWVVLPNIIATNVRADAVESAIQTVSQFKTIRTYYMKNVIKKTIDNGKPLNHKNMKDGIPLPATFIHDMSALLSEKDTTVSLYSA